MQETLGGLVCVVPFVLLISAVCGAVVGSRQNCTGEGLAFGLFLGPFGVIAAGFLDQRPKCPACGSRLNLAGRAKGRLTADGYPYCPSCKSRLAWNRGTPELATQPQRQKTAAGA